MRANDESSCDVHIKHEHCLLRSGDVRQVDIVVTRVSSKNIVVSRARGPFLRITLHP